MSKTKITKYTVEATIPTATYANIRPSIEFETTDLKEASKIAIDHFIDMSVEVGEKGASLSRNKIEEEVKKA